MTWPGRSVLDLVNEVAGGVLTAEQAPTGPALPGARSARQGCGGLAGRRLPLLTLPPWVMPSCPAELLLQSTQTIVVCRMARVTG
jgi:hypothetical protein